MLEMSLIKTDVSHYRSMWDIYSSIKLAPTGTWEPFVFVGFFPGTVGLQNVPARCNDMWFGCRFINGQYGRSIFGIDI